MYNCKMFTIDE